MLLYLVGSVKRTMPYCEKNRCLGHLTDTQTNQFLIIGMFKCVKQSPELCSRNTAHPFNILFFYFIFMSCARTNTGFLKARQFLSV